MALLILVEVLAALSLPPETEIEDLVASERYDLALRALDELLGSSEAGSPEARRRLDLEKLRARCLFELGDYSSCEKQLRALLDKSPGPGTPDHLEYLARLAQALTLQDLHDEAIQVLEDAIRAQDAPALRRLAITALLRASRLAEILPHAESLLAADSSDPFAHFVRGIALASKDRLEEALSELSWGLKMPDAKRESRFQLALVEGKLRRPEQALEHLLEIVADDPYDEEACYQAAQQMARMRSPEARQTAAHLRDYFQALKDAQGESSRDVPLQAIGQAALAAVMRADKWKRLCVYDRALSEMRRAQAVARGDPEPFFYEADFWTSVGLFREAEAALSRLAGGPVADAQGVSVRSRRLREALASGLETLKARAGDDPLGKARLELAKTSWEDAQASLEMMLVAAVQAGKPSLADQAARLLLARDPRSIRALAYFSERAAVPSLLVPRIHYLTRLARLLPDDERYQNRLRAARQTFLGKEAPAARSH